MALVDRRLLRRARAVRVALAVDAGLGVIAALLILAQAVLLARVAARGFAGASLTELAGPLVLFVAVTAGRAGAAWGFEVVGRRAAIDVLSKLRLGVVTRRLRDEPAALDGSESAEVATAAVAGVDALETVFAKTVPQAVLAVVVPVAVLAVVAWIDPLSAAIMLVTLPLIPVFMWLIGRTTARHTRARWRTLARLATHFHDVVKGLPTLRAFNRAEAQTERIAEVSEQYRMATMSTLRLAFLSGAVLELAATLGIALVAVTVGVRLVEGGLGLEAALTVLVLAPELYLPLRGLAAQFHAGADGLAVAGRLLDLAGEQDERPGRVGHGPPSPRLEPIRFEGVSFEYPGRARRVLDALDLELDPGETVVLVGPSGVGKSTVAGLLLRLLDPTGGRLSVGSVDLTALDAAAWRAQLAWVPQRPTMFRGTAADNIRLGDPSADDARVRAAARARRCRRLHPRRFPADTGRFSARAVERSRRANVNASRSRAPSCATPSL